LKVPRLGTGYLPPAIPLKLLDHYTLYLETANWRRLRRKVLKRAKGRCELCVAAAADDKMGFVIDPLGTGIRQARVVHHLSYERLFWERLTDLCALCFSCHAAAHPGNQSLMLDVALDEIWVDSRLEAIV